MFLQNKLDQRETVQRRDWKMLTRLNAAEDVLDFLQKEVASPVSPILTWGHPDLLKALRTKITQLLDSHISTIRDITLKNLPPQVTLETRIIKLVNVIMKIIENNYTFGESSQEDFSRRYLDIFTYCQNYELVGAVMQLISRQGFVAKCSLLFYYVKAYMIHWNSFNNRRLPIKQLLSPPKDFVFEFSHDEKVHRIESSVQELRKTTETLNAYNLAKQLLEGKNIIESDPIFHGMLCKVRIAVCPAEQLKHIIKTCVSACEMFSYIELDIRKNRVLQIPNIFTFPPDYTTMFKEFIELLLCKDCDPSCQIHILQTVKSILILQDTEWESELILSLAENYNLLQKIINDIYHHMKGQTPEHLTEQVLDNKQFMKCVLWLFNVNNVEPTQVFNYTSDIVQHILNSGECDPEIIRISGKIFINCCQDEAAENRINDWLLNKIIQGTSPHLNIYIEMIISMLEGESRRNIIQRRDSANLAKKIAESEIFKSIIPKLERQFTAKSLTANTIELISKVCSESPVLSDKLKDVISAIVEIVLDPSNIPAQIQIITSIANFYYNVCLKEGAVRDVIIETKALTNFMQVFVHNKHATNFKGKCLLALFSSINRFLTNIRACILSIFEGLLLAFQRALNDAHEFEKYFDQYLEGEPVEETVDYESVTSKINNVMRLLHKISANLEGSQQLYKSLYGFVEGLFNFRYLNIHNPIANRWITANVKISDITSLQEKSKKRSSILNEINEIAGSIKIIDVSPQLAQTNFFKLCEMVAIDSEAREFLKTMINMNRLNRLINVAKNTYKQTIYQDLTQIFSLAGPLDMYRYRDELSILKKEIIQSVKKEDAEQKSTNLNAPETSHKEISQRLTQKFKQLADRSYSPVMLQYSLKKMLIDAERQSSFVINTEVVKCLLSQIESLKKTPKENTLDSVYFVKLKLDSIQLMLQLSPTLSNADSFAFNFTVFTYLYLHDPKDLFDQFVQILNAYSQKVPESLKGTVDEKVIDCLRGEVINKIIIMIQHIANIPNGDSEDVASDSRKAVNYTLIKLEQALIHLIVNYPQEAHSSVDHNQISIKSCLKETLVGLQTIMMISRQNRKLLPCALEFASNDFKSVDQDNFIKETNRVFEEFADQALENLRKYRMCEMPVIELILQHATSSQRIYERKQGMMKTYNSTLTAIIRVSKYLFVDYPINLGVKHPKVRGINYEEVDVRAQVQHLTVFISMVVRICKGIPSLGWVGTGQITVTMNVVNQIIKLTTQIASNVEDLRRDDPTLESMNLLIHRTMCLVSGFIEYDKWREEQLKKPKESQLAETEPVKVKKPERFKPGKVTLREMRRYMGRSESVVNLLSLADQEQQFQKKLNKQKLDKHQKNKGEKKKQKAGPVKTFKGFSDCVQDLLDTVLTKSKSTPLMKCETFSTILQLIEKHLKLDKDSIHNKPEQSRNRYIQLDFQQLVPSLFRVRLMDNERMGILYRTIIICSKTYTFTQVNNDIEASIKRIFFENSGEIKYKDLATWIKKLGEHFAIPQMWLAIKGICKFKNEAHKDQEVKADSQLPDEVVQLKEGVEYDQFYLHSLQSNTRKDSATATLPRKQSGNQQKCSVTKEGDDGFATGGNNNSSKVIDYLPEQQLQTILSNIIQVMIESIFEIAKAKLENNQINQKEGMVYDFNMASKILRYLIYDSPCLLSYVTRFRCKKPLTTCIQGVENPNTKAKLMELIVKEERRSSNNSNVDASFLALLIRLFNPICTDKIRSILFFLCLDNCLLIKSPKGQVMGMSSLIRYKIIDELSQVSQSWWRNIINLRLLLTLAKIKDFAKLCIQEGVVTGIHKQLINVSKTQNSQLLASVLPFFSHPLTTLHVVNMALNVQKTKPALPLGKMLTQNIYNQLVPREFFRKDTFLDNWLYQTNQDQLHPGGYLRVPSRSGRFRNFNERYEEQSRSGSEDGDVPEYFEEEAGSDVSDERIQNYFEDGDEMGMDEPSSQEGDSQLFLDGFSTVSPNQGEEEDDDDQGIEIQIDADINEPSGDDDIDIQELEGEDMDEGGEDNQGQQGYSSDQEPDIEMSSSHFDEDHDIEHEADFDDIDIDEMASQDLQRAAFQDQDSQVEQRIRGYLNSGLNSVPESFRSLEREVHRCPPIRRMSQQLDDMIKRLLRQTNVDSNLKPLLDKLKLDFVFGLAAEVKKMVDAKQHSIHQHMKRDPFTLTLEFPEPRLLYDDSAHIYPSQRRRQGEIFIGRRGGFRASRTQPDDFERRMGILRQSLRSNPAGPRHTIVLGGPEVVQERPAQVVPAIDDQIVESEIEEQLIDQGEIEREGEVDVQVQGQEGDEQLDQLGEMDLDGDNHEVELEGNEGDEDMMVEDDEMGGTITINLEQSLRDNGFDLLEFQSLPAEVRQDIINNLIQPQLTMSMNMNPQQNDNPPLQSQDNNQRAEQQEQQPNNEAIRVEEPQAQAAEEPAPAVPQAVVAEQIPDRRRKLSQDYIKRLANDPRSILAKENRQSKIYLCEDDFIVGILSLLYMDESTYTNFPFSMIDSLCGNPANETRILSTLMIILKHPHLDVQKMEHEESRETFPKTIVEQKNNEIVTDYSQTGYCSISLKIIHLLSHLSKNSPASLLQKHHVKVNFLPEWYWLQEKHYYSHLIELVEYSVFKETAHLSFLIESLKNITNHYCLNFIHESQQNEKDNKEAGEFHMKLTRKEVQQLCSILESDSVPPEGIEHLSNIIMLLCVSKQNLSLFMEVLYILLDELSVRLNAELNNKSEQEPFGEGKLHNLLSIVYHLFESEYKFRLQKSEERAAVKSQVLSSFKGLIECRSLQELCRNCVGYMCDHSNDITPFQMGRLCEILDCFFIIYQITIVEDEQKQQKRNIAALASINIQSPKLVETAPQPQQESISEGNFSLESLFKYICGKGKNIINHMLKQKLGIMKKTRHNQKEALSIFDEPIICILTKHPHLIDFENKRLMFKTEIKNLRANKNYPDINLLINRENLLGSSMNEIMIRTADELKGKISIEFMEERGRDMGGLTKEWYMELSKQIFNANYAIFKPSSTGNTYQPSPQSYINPHHLRFFKFIGRIVGKAMHDGYMLDAYFTPAFYKHILGTPITMHDMEAEDYEFYKNMKWILENDITNILDHTFSYEFDNFGELEVRDLIPDGRNIPVTEENKHEYVQKLCYAKMATAIEKQIQAFLEGFHELIPPKLISFFDWKELELLISGLPTIDIQDLKENTDLTEYRKTDNIIVWLFEILESYDSNLRAAFLQFVTGTTRVPTEGFKGLRGYHGPQKFNIHKAHNIALLPVAHTCFNQLDLPNYPTKQMLAEKLTFVITWANVGFGEA